MFVTLAYDGIYYQSKICWFSMTRTYRGMTNRLDSSSFADIAYGREIIANIAIINNEIV